MDEGYSSGCGLKYPMGPVYIVTLVPSWEVIDGNQAIEQPCIDADSKRRRLFVEGDEYQHPTGSRP